MKKGKNQNKIMLECPNCHIKISQKDFQNHLDTHPSQIFDWLFIGSYSNATNKKELEKYNIKYILNCANECNNLFENKENNDIKYLKLPLSDILTCNIKEHFQEAIDFLNLAKKNYEEDKNKGNVLVHCQLGKSRSSSIIIAYMIHSMDYTTNSAYLFLKKKRRNIMPNLSFMNQLREFEKEVEKSKSETKNEEKNDSKKEMDKK